MQASSGRWFSPYAFGKDELRGRSLDRGSEMKRQVSFGMSNPIANTIIA
jgi:hypothetical protein